MTFDSDPKQDLTAAQRAEQERQALAARTEQRTNETTPGHRATDTPGQARTGDGNGLNIGDVRGGVPTNRTDMARELQTVKLVNPSAQAAETYLTNAQGQKMHGIIETQPNGQSFFYQPKADGSGWTQSQLLTAKDGSQVLKPTDGSNTAVALKSHSEQPIATTPSGGHFDVPKRNEASLGNNGQRDLPPVPQRQLPPGLDGNNPALREQKPAVVNNLDAGHPLTPSGTKPGSDGVNLGAMTQEQRRELHDRTVLSSTEQSLAYKSGDAATLKAVSDRQAQLDSIAGSSAQNRGASQFTPEFKGMDPVRRNEVIDQAGRQLGQPKIDAPQLQGKVEVIAAAADRTGQPKAPQDVRPSTDGRPASDGKPGGGGGGDKPLGAEKAPGTIGEKTGDGKGGAGVGGGRGDGVNDIRGGKPVDIIPHMQIDGRLLAQLQGLRGNQESKLQLADIIGKFENGKGPLDRKEAGMMDIFKGMKPEQLTGLKAWLIDSTKNPFDFKQLDLKTQQAISKIFDALSDKTSSSSRMLDLLGDKRSGIDRVPTGDQSKTLLSDFIKGMRDGQAGDGKDLRTTLTGRLGKEEGGTDFRLNAKDLNTVIRDLLERLQSKDFMTSMNNDRTAAMNTERSATMTRNLDAKDLAQGKELTKDGVKELLGKDEKGSFKLSESIKDIINKGELTRGLTSEMGKPGDAHSQTQTRVIDADALKGKADAKSDTTPDGKPKAADGTTDTTTTAKSKEEADRTRMLNLTEKERLDKEEERRKLEEENTRKQKLEDEERLKKEEEKRKEEERKRRADEEFIHTVSEGETLKSIAFKYTGRTAEDVYARNLPNIMLKEHKGRKYALPFTGQKLVIPSENWVQNFRQSMTSYSNIDFDKIPYASAEEELAEKLGAGWAGGKAAKREPLFGKDEAGDQPVTRRSFSGKTPLSDEERKQNVKEQLGIKSGSADSPRYVVKLGQQLRSISQKLYGDPTYWRLIAAKNDLSTDTDSKGDPVAVLRKGQQLFLPDADELHEFKQGKRPESEATEDISEQISQIAPVELHDVLLTDQQPEMSFSPDEQENTVVSNRAAAQESTVVSNHAISQKNADLSNTAVVSSTSHPLPRAEVQAVEIAFEDTDPMWTPNPESERLEDFVYMSETETLNGDTRGLSVVLQMYHGGEWRVVAEYQIFPDSVFQIRYSRSGERERRPSSLPPKAAKQLAHNDFRKNWQDILRAFWRT